MRENTALKSRKPILGTFLSSLVVSCATLFFNSFLSYCFYSKSLVYASNKKVRRLSEKSEKLLVGMVGGVFYFTQSFHCTSMVFVVVTFLRVYS